MTSNICAIHDIADDIELWGGKALGLSRLSHNGFLLPKTLVISSEIYKAYKNHVLDIQEFVSTITDIINHYFPDPKTQLIFRSSANIEGREKTVCCGIYESKVHHAGDSYFDTIRAVWDSTQSLTAQKYYVLTGQSADDVSMAVIVQEIKKERATAVIQTHDMINDTSGIILEYSFDAENSIVDGIFDAEVAYINRPEDVPTFMKPELRMQLISDCRKAESIFGTHLEIEAQIGEDNIYYLQARTLV